MLTRPTEEELAKYREKVGNDTAGTDLYKARSSPHPSALFRPYCDRPSASRPVLSRQNRLRALLEAEQSRNNADGSDEDRA